MSDDPFNLDEEHLRQQMKKLAYPNEFLQRLRKAFEAVPCPKCGRLRALRPTEASTRDLGDGYTLHRTDGVEDYDPEIHCPSTIGRECSA